MESVGGGQQISSDFILRNFVIRPDMCGPPSPERGSDRATEPPRVRAGPDQTNPRDTAPRVRLTLALRLSAT